MNDSLYIEPKGDNGDTNKKKNQHALVDDFGAVI